MTGDAGETDLATLIAGMEPKLATGRYCFRMLGDAEAPPADWFALIRETEGTSLIAPDTEGAWALMSLQIHSSLGAVGLTAAFSAALAAEGIPSNVVAGYRHDHLLVPWHKRDAALSALKRLAETAR